MMRCEGLKVKEYVIGIAHGFIIIENTHTVQPSPCQGRIFRIFLAF